MQVTFEPGDELVFEKRMTVGVGDDYTFEPADRVTVNASDALWTNLQARGERRVRVYTTSLVAWLTETHTLSFYADAGAPDVPAAPAAPATPDLQTVASKIAELIVLVPEHQREQLKQHVVNACPNGLCTACWGSTPCHCQNDS